MEAEKVINLEKKYIMQTYERANIVFSYGKGMFLYDVNKKQYLDFISGIATASLGHGNPVIANILSKQASKLINASNLFYTEEQVTLGKKLVELSGLDKCFFSNSGTESVECAIKLARKYTKRATIISTENAFHGRTLGALSVTWKEKFRKPFEPLIPNVRFIPYNNLSALREVIDDTTSSFIVEPIQGEAGVIVPDKDYLRGVKKICEENNILLIIDEIQTNLRCEKFFAYQNEGIIPDIITVAKGIAGGVPIGITIASDKVAKAFNNGEHGSTFGGNSLSCAVANSVIDYVVKNKLVENTGSLGEYFIKELRNLKDKYKIINEVRGRGLMLGIELLKPIAKDIVEKCAKDGLLINKCSEYVLRFLPPLIVKEKDIDECVEILDRGFESCVSV